MNSGKLKCKQYGFSIIELLIIIILIGILVAIIIPRIATRTELARQKTAMSDLENIAKAEEMSMVDTSYIYRLYVLNDTKGAGDGVGFGAVGDVNDAFTDEYSSSAQNTMYNNPFRIFIDTETGLFAPDGTAITLMNNAVMNETAFGWNGPYLVVRRDEDSLPFGYSGQRPDGIPDDPWGNNYLLFTKAGLIFENDGIIRTTVDFPGGYAGYNCQIFDRGTVLSLGKNGVPGDGSGPSANIDAPGNFGQGDDLVIHF